MQGYIGIIVLCIIAGGLSCITHGIYSKKASAHSGGNVDAKQTSSHSDGKMGANRIIKTTVFYILMFYAALSVFKTLLGYGRLTWLESFDEISRKTYLHYSLPVLIIVIAAPFVLRKLLREKTDAFVEMAVSVLAGMYAVVYLLFETVTNITTICIFAAGIAAALLITFLYKEEVGYFTKQNLKERLKLIIPVILFWIIYIMLYLPNELYLNNVEEMSVPYGIFIMSLICGALIYLVVYTVVTVYFLTDRQFSLVCEIIFAVSLAGYVQSMFLNGKMDVMDGGVQVWTLLTKMVNVIIWMAVIAVIVLLKFIIKKNVDKTYAMLCIYLSCVQLLTWGYMGLTTETENARGTYELTTEGRMELDSEHNVIVFILDWYDEQLLDRAIAEHDNYLEPLKDFTWYKNTTSLYSFTAMSIPYLLTDVEWEYDMKESDYRDYAFENGNFLYDIAARNYDIGVYTFGIYVSESMRDVIRNYSDISMQGWNYSAIFKQMMECSKYKSYPFALKGRYWYADASFERVMHTTDIHSTTDDEPFYQELINEGIQVRDSDEYDGAYRFYHLYGMHIPFEPDAMTQARYCMDIVDEYLKQLKEAGLYDEAEIIITADHGHGCLAMPDRMEEYDLENPSSPILFVKKSGQSYDGDTPEVSMAPVSHAQLPSTIIEAIYGETLGYGETFDDIDEDDERERYYIYKRSNDIPYTKYKIDGYVRDWNNWSIEETDRIEEADNIE